MQTKLSHGTFEDLFPLLPVSIAQIAYHLRGLIDNSNPHIIEIPKPKENHAEYAIGTGKSSEIFAYICPMEKYVRLGFYYGSELPDPTGVLVGEGKRLRHVKISTLKEAESPTVQALITAAMQERSSTRKGS